MVPLSHNRNLRAQCAQNVAYWHKADMAITFSDVRLLGGKMDIPF